MSDGTQDLLFSRRHLVRSLIRLTAVVCVGLGVVPLLEVIGSDVLSGFSGSLTNPINYVRYRREDQVSMLLIMGGLALVLWLLQGPLTRLIVPPIARACPECGYELKRLTSPRCPECGSDLPQAMVSGVHEERTESSRVGNS